MDTLLLEIGAEEIPAGYIRPALDAMAQNLLKRLDAARIGHGEARTCGTPRRLTVMVDGVADKQETVTEDLMGPPEKIAFDDAGKPTMAAVKFAEKAGVAVGRLTVVETGKGRYLSARKTHRGQATRRLLKTILPEVILATPFPKSMRWADLSIQFARPIQSIVALLGGKVVAFSLGDRIKSGRHALGHMFMNPGKVAIDSPETYETTLAGVNVLVDIAKRREMTATAVAEAARGIGGEVLPDEELLDIVTNLVEIPVATAGQFDDIFLEVPKEILITAMREHQKYFAVVDATGRLMPGFIAINNTRTRDMDLVATGHERVLRARLSDARYFYNADIKVPMETWVEKLKRVLFQAKLGSMYDKMTRVKSLAAWLADAINPAQKENVTRAAHLCKADLVSQVVGEFAKLQGIMGRTYALAAGEPPDVAAAIEEHYRPTHSGGQLPETETGALLSIAEKIDSICGCFSVGLVPTGAADPYALRRQGIGILQIMRSRNIGISLTRLVETGVALFADKSSRPAAETVDAVLTFLGNRFARLLADEGLSKDVIAAVMGASAERVPDVERRVAALEKLKGKPDFEPLAAAFKRVENILKKASLQADATVDPALFGQPAESALHAACQSVTRDVDQRLAQEDLDGALATIATLRDPVDAFFTDVMVMAEDPAVRSNRLALLATISAIFGQIADFSQIST
ncbi:glycine--tRNA ligase beta subunit [Desulfosarcina ovata subsp. sediminis]|uniref:Glycine--tRNA ligase beta subunit n=1 Tax=Desulfosarcina ovata subsp. sediminis TaxID=885957 RepID=A0A5K8A1D9_9BACT|nr:glycine--tRNA ligase subunit beta [Desulfosarcina ovata]BBO86395.1 glycine--tRNA ligase beta subunit [Desulfosarcina ovata subsp. sediminis]